LKSYEEKSLGEDKSIHDKFDFWNLRESSEQAEKAYRMNR